MAIIEIKKQKEEKRKFATKAIASKAYKMRIMGHDIGFFYSKSEAVAWLFGALCFAVVFPYGVWWFMHETSTAKYEGERRNELTIPENTVGCRELEDFRRLAELGASHDDAAFEKQLQAHVAKQTCRRIPAVAKAHRDGHSSQYGADRVRLEGEAERWWIKAQ